MRYSCRNNVGENRVLSFVCIAHDCTQCVVHKCTVFCSLFQTALCSLYPPQAAVARLPLRVCDIYKICFQIHCLLLHIIKSKIPKTFLFLSHCCHYWCGIIQSQHKGTANIVPIKQCISFFI